ncbi:MAG: flagellar hook assembly protein FlgD [Geobacter sp.]|nr:flagellar hook assembly protein FlgD [Geobacter sp.]
MITSVTSTTSSTASSSMKEATGLDKDDFLKLFIEQLKNQDPLDPQDSSEFIAQLAQLTQVEQAYNTTTALQNLLAAQNNSSSLSSVSFIGKSITANGDGISFDGSSAAELQYNLEGAANSVTITISDESGAAVRTVTQSGLEAGDHSYTWDGKNSSGELVSAGAYTFAVSATSSSGVDVTATTYTTGLVDGVSLSDDTPALTLGAVSVPLTDVISIKAL